MSAVQMTPPKPVQRWSAEDYARKGRFVSELARPALDLLAPREGERILDLGCGDGVLTEEIAACGADVLGADLSEELLAAAAAKGLKVQKVDGHALPFEGEFDAVFTNAALHWMRRPELVIAGIHQALRPRGRFAGEFGGHGNVAAIATALRAVGALHGGESSSRSLSGGKCSPRSSSFCARRSATLTGCGRRTISGCVLPRSGLGEGRPRCPRHTDARFMAEALACQGRPA